MVVKSRGIISDHSDYSELSTTEIVCRVSMVKLTEHLDGIPQSELKDIVDIELKDKITKLSYGGDPVRAGVITLFETYPQYVIKIPNLKISTYRPTELLISDVDKIRVNFLSKVEAIEEKVVLTNSIVSELLQVIDLIKEKTISNPDFANLGLDHMTSKNKIIVIKALSSLQYLLDAEQDLKWM